MTILTVSLIHTKLFWSPLKSDGRSKFLVIVSYKPKFLYELDKKDDNFMIEFREQIFHDNPHFFDHSP